MLSAFVSGVACVAVLLTQFAYIVVMPLLAGYAMLMGAQTDRLPKRPYLILVTCFLPGGCHLDCGNQLVSLLGSSGLATATPV